MNPEAVVKRFAVMTTLLIVLLLIASAVQADDDSRVTVGPTTERANFFDHGVRSSVKLSTASHPEIDRERRIDAPRRGHDGVRLRLRDRDYAAVWIEADALDWERRPMRFDPGTDRWTIELDLPRGRTRYVFVVEDPDGTTRVRTDAANPRRRRDVERGWVSEVVVDRDGDVVEIDARPRRRSHAFDDTDLEIFDRLVVGYQRVDGLVLGVAPQLLAREPFTPTLDGFLTHGFSSGRWSARLSVLQPLTPGGGMRVHLAAYDRTDTIDRTGVGWFENSASTLLFREDDLDWFRREGLSAGLEFDVTQHLLARIEMRSDTYSSLPRTVIAGWGGREDFLPNPAIDDGVMRSVFARVRFGSDLDHLWLEFETSDDDLLPSDFDFTQVTAQARTRLRAGRDGRLDLRLRYGAALSGELPRQRRYLAGGIGTVRGYTYQSLLLGGPEDLYGGEQMLLANAELVLDDDDLGVALFADAGQVWADHDAAIDLEDLVASVGVGLLLDADGEEGLRLDLIRTLESGGRFMAQLRLRRPF